ncbi:MAG: flavin reductase family protein [Alphaproteobacteria bacterium]|nr:flavin reductase family protein [Alphaproteobacteria bacterium]
MFYRPEDGHGLPHNPFSAIITPRPIGWISSRSADGIDNLAPYSFFNGVAYAPPQVMFASTGTKDSLRNIRETRVFCVNIVSLELTDQMNQTSQSFDHTVNEFTEAEIDSFECETITCARVAASPASLECKMTQITQIEGADNHVIFGEVTGIHLADTCMVDGRFDVTKFTPLSRLGYRDYTAVRETFELKRPDDAPTDT